VRKSIRLVLISLLVVAMLGLSACGKEEPEEVVTDTVEETVVKEEPEEVVEEEPEEVEEVVEEENEESQEEVLPAGAYAYYSELSKQFQDYTKGCYEVPTIFDAMTDGTMRIWCDNGKYVVAYRERYVDINNEYTWVTFSLDSPEVTTVFTGPDGANNYYNGYQNYCDGVIWAITNRTSNNFSLVRKELAGDEKVFEINGDIEYVYALHDGACVAKVNNGHSIADYVYITKDGPVNTINLDDIALPEKEIEHGLTEEVEIKPYKNMVTLDGKIYFIPTDYSNSVADMYYIDIKNPTEFVQDISLKDPTGRNALSDESNRAPLVLKDYILDPGQGYIYTIADSTHWTYGAVAPAGDIAKITYLGGENHYMFGKVQNTFTAYKGALDYTTNETLTDSQKIGDMELKYGTFYLLDDSNYILKDEYGIFLRTFDGGEADEKTIALYSTN